MMTQRNDHIFIELWRGSRKSAAGTISVLSYLKHIIMFDTDIWVFQHPSTWSIHCCFIRLKLWPEGGGGGIQTLRKGGVQSQAKFLSALRASVWFKNKAGVGGLTHLLDPPLTHKIRYQLQDKSVSAMHYYEPIAGEQATFMYLGSSASVFTN